MLWSDSLHAGTPRLKRQSQTQRARQPRWLPRDEFCCESVNYFAMTRVLALLVTIFPAVALTLAEDQSRPNKSEESNSFNAELPILKQKLSGDRSAPETPGDAVARLEKRLEEAKRDAKSVERLCKHGVLSKVEMEQRLLNVI